MICNWIEIEDNPIVQEVEVEEAIAQLEMTEAQTATGVESESEGGSNDDEDTAMSITTHHEAEVMIGNLISYCRR